MSESSKNKLDEYDSTTNYHHLKFENRCLRGSGDDFQKLFEDIMVRARPGEFERVRPYGRFGDRKCDGLIESEGTIFQVYSPDELKQAKVQKKIDKDLEGAIQDWSGILKKWVFVYNAKRGTSSDIKLTLQQKQKQYPDIEIDSWSNDYLWEITRELSLQQRSEILGASPQWNVEKPKSKAHIPNLPFHFLKRSTDLDTLKNLVLSSSIQSTGITRSALKVGMYGMGGIGKSVLAAMLARDPEVRAAFPDGIFWITLGQEPILALRQLDLARILGDASLPFQDVQQGKIHLSQLLGDKTCLLILDDVWKADHAAAFNILGEQSGFLFTTRDSSIVKTLNASEHRVNLLSDDEALELLAACSGQCQETLPIEAHEIVKECGNLPLALSMIGAIAKARPNRWDNLLHKLQNADLDKIRHQFPDYPYPDLLKAIQVSVDALEPAVKVRYLDFAVFPENAAIPETTLRTFWEPEGLSKYDTQDVIDTLMERSLARRDETGNLSLHNLQCSYVKKLVPNMYTLHSRLLEAYTTYCPQGWHSYLESDDYFFENLAYHLQQAEREDELNVLLTASSDWMRTKFDRYKSHTSYATDLELALSNFTDPLEIDELLILVQIQAARQVAYGWSKRYTNIDLETLVWLGREKEAEGYAKTRSIEENKLYGLLAIYKALYEKDKLKRSHIVDAFKHLYIILSNTNRSYEEVLNNFTLFLIQSDLAAVYSDFVREVVKDLKDKALSTLIIKIIENGQDQEIEKWLLAVEKLVSYKTSNLEKIEIYCDLSLVLFNGGHITEANAFFLKIRAIIAEIHKETTEESVFVWCEIEALLKFAKFLLRLNTQEFVIEANQLLTRAQEAIFDEEEAIFDKEEYFAKAYLSEILVDTLSDVGRLDEAKKTAYLIPENSYHRAPALSKVANSLARNGNSKESNLLLKEATNTRYINSEWLSKSISKLINSPDNFKPPTVECGFQHHH